MRQRFSFFRSVQRFCCKLEAMNMLSFFFITKIYHSKLGCVSKYSTTMFSYTVSNNFNPEQTMFANIGNAFVF